MKSVRWLVLGVLFLAGAAAAQDQAMILVAHPAFHDLEWRQTVVIAAPAPSGASP